MILLTFQQKSVWQIAWRSHRRKQTTWSQQWKPGDYWKLMFSQTWGHPWSIRTSCLHGAEYSGTREKSVFPERFEDFDLTSFTRRTIPCDVCENFHGFWESRCNENNVCSCRTKHPFIREDDDTGHDMNAIIKFLSISRSFSSSVVAMSTSRLHWCLRDKQSVPGTSSWRLRLPILWRLSLQGRKAPRFWLWKWKWRRWMAWHRKPMVSSAGFIISLFRWAGAAGIYGRIGLGKFLSNLSVCFLHCPCGTWNRHETCVGRSSIWRPWLDEWCYVPRCEWFDQAHTFDCCVSAAQVQDHVC